MVIKMEPSLRMARMTRIKSEGDDVPTVDEKSKVKDMSLGRAGDGDLNGANCTAHSFKMVLMLIVVNWKHRILSYDVFITEPNIANNVKVCQERGNQVT